MDLEYGPVRMLNVVFTYILYALMHEFFLCKPHSKILAFLVCDAVSFGRHLSTFLGGLQHPSTYRTKCRRIEEALIFTPVAVGTSAF